jgi:hypothetical protein
MKTRPAGGDPELPVVWNDPSVVIGLKSSRGSSGSTLTGLE